MIKEWLLTDQEKQLINESGVDVIEAQKAKEQAYNTSSNKGGRDIQVVTHSAALQYICRIRNLRKHNYALDYLDYLRGCRLEPNRGTLSYMAAQGVRNTLAELEK